MKISKKDKDALIGHILTTTTSELDMSSAAMLNVVYAIDMYNRTADVEQYIVKKNFFGFPIKKKIAVKKSFNFDGDDLYSIFKMNEKEIIKDAAMLFQCVNREIKKAEGIMDDEQKTLLMDTIMKHPNLRFYVTKLFIEGCPYNFDRAVVDYVEKHGK